MPYAAAIRAAAGTLRDVAHRTPVASSRLLDALAGGGLRLKLESLQRSGAFKFRGAYNALVRNLDLARPRGVVTASSGNHGGAVALAAALLGVPAVIVMPEDAARVKLAAIEGTGARAVFEGLSSTDRLARAREFEAEGWFFLPPFDHPDVIAGQGTTALEALEQVPEATVFLAPVGGGGLLAGCAAWLGETRPDVTVIGVEPDAADDFRQSLLAGERITIGHPETIADGARNVTPGELTFPVVREHVSGIVTVSEDEIRTAMLLLLTRAKIVAEPTGALAAAAILSGRIRLEGRTAIAVVSGGNVDPASLAACLGA